MIQVMGNTNLYWIVGSLFALLLVFWLVYRTVKAAVRSALKESGLVVVQPHLSRGRRQQELKNDFVYTEPRSEQ